MCGVEKGAGGGEDEGKAKKKSGIDRRSWADIIQLNKIQAKTW